MPPRILVDSANLTDGVVKNIANSNDVKNITLMELKKSTVIKIIQRG